MSVSRVLVTGGTGYIGGSVLTNIVASQNPPLKDISIFALVRGESNAKVLTGKGIDVELFESLNQTELLEDIASRYDVIISCVIGYHAASASAFIRGLAKRMKSTGKQTYFIQTSGSSNLGDLSPDPSNPRVFSDKEPIYALEKAREAEYSYIQRVTDVAVTETGLETGVKTTILMPPTIYGLGSGFFNKVSVQIPQLFGAALEHGQAVKVGGENTRSHHVHIEDLVALYEILLVRLVEGKDVSSGEQGIVFANAEAFAWSEMSAGIAKALKKRGKIDTEEVRILNLEEAAEKFGTGDVHMVKVGFALNARMKADVAREWGWKPQKTHQDFLDTFENEADAILEGKKDYNYGSHVNRG